MFVGIWKSVTQLLFKIVLQTINAIEYALCVGLVKFQMTVWL